MKKHVALFICCSLLVIVAVNGCISSSAIATPTKPIHATQTPSAKPTPTPTLVLPTATPTNLEQAIASLRRLDPNTFDDKQIAAIDQATQTITEAGTSGAALLKRELTTIEQAGESDVYFQLLACWLLWDIGNLDEAETIATTWSSIPSRDWLYQMLFYPAMQAASTQDPRALPMLKVILSDKEGSVFLEKHFLNLEFPLTHEFIWGAYGSKGIPVLYEILQTSQNPVEIESAINLLSRAQYLPALPLIRDAVNSKNPDVKRAAIIALGIFGHPDDYNLIVEGLELSDTDTLFAYVYAAIEFGDTRITPYLLPLLDSKDKDIRGEVAWGLGNYLASPDGLIALKKTAAKTTDSSWAKQCEAYVKKVLDNANLTWEEFENLPAQKQVDITDKFRYAEITLKPGEKAIDHDQLLEVVAEWRENGGISSTKWDWVETRHILPGATADDIDLLLDGKAGFYLRLSDECIYEVRTVDELIKWLGRSRYR